MKPEARESERIRRFPDRQTSRSGWWITLGVLAAFSRSVHAAEASDAEAAGRGAIIELNQPQQVPTALDSVKHPWPGVALALSAVGTAIPIVPLTRPHQGGLDRGTTFACLAAEIITPSSGHLYAGLTRRALTGMGVRAVGFGIVAAGSVNAGFWDDTASSDLTWGAVFVVLGGTIMAASAAWDVITVPSEVEHRNAEWLRTHARLETRMLPGARAPAIALALRF